MGWPGPPKGGEGDTGGREICVGRQESQATSLGAHLRCERRAARPGAGEVCIARPHRTGRTDGVDVGGSAGREWEGGGEEGVATEGGQ